MQAPERVFHELWTQLDLDGGLSASGRSVDRLGVPVLRRLLCAEVTLTAPHADAGETDTAVLWRRSALLPLFEELVRLTFQCAPEKLPFVIDFVSRLDSDSSVRETLSL